MSVQDYSDYEGEPLAPEQMPRSAHPDFLHWNDLSRPARKALARLLGGGSLRGVERGTVWELYRFGLIDEDEQFAQLTRAGWDTLKSSRDWLRS